MSRIYNKCNQRLYFLRTHQKNVNRPVDFTILRLFYKSIIQSVLSFCITFWHGNATATDINKLDKIIKCAERLGCNTVRELHMLYSQAVYAEMNKIISNERHPLNKFFCLLPSGSRMNVMYSRTNRLKKSFIPKAIKMYNDYWIWSVLIVLYYLLLYCLPIFVSQQVSCIMINKEYLILLLGFEESIDITRLWIYQLVF